MANKKHLTTAEVAKRLRCTPKTVREYVAAGKLPALKRGYAKQARLLFNLEDVKKLLVSVSEQK